MAARWYTWALVVTSSGVVELEFWLRSSGRVDTTMAGVVTNLQQELAAQQQTLQQLQSFLEAQQASAVQREREREERERVCVRCKLNRQTCQTSGT